MGKLDELRRRGAAAAAESMGAGIVPGAGAIHGVSPPPPLAVPAHLQGVAKAKNAAVIPTDKIAPDPDQPREEFEPEALGRLAASMKARGQLQPIRVRWDEARARYAIVVGERRWRAARQAGIPALACVIVEGAIDPAEMLAVQLVENMVREDLRPVEQARAFKTLIDRNGWSTRRLAEELNVAQPQVVRALALLDLPGEVQDKVEQGALPPATAYEISKVPDPVEQTALAARVVAEGLTRDDAARVVRDAAARPRPAKGKAPRRPTARAFRTAAGPRVTVEFKKGLTPGLILEALREAILALEAEQAPGERDAA